MSQPLQYYIDQLAQGTISKDEWVILQQLLQNPAHSEELANVLDLQLSELASDYIRYPDVAQRVQAAVALRIADEQSASAPVVHRVQFLRTAWFRWAAAILIMVGIGSYFYVTNQHSEKPAVARVTPAPAQADILPGSNKAVLTLSSGARVTLDSASSGTITDQELSIDNKNGQLIYTGSELVAMNTMTTPKGGQYQLMLADGSRVWLNAASSITYPTAFTAKTREVTITGEAYFEVRGDKAKPFIVHTSTDQITVLGTSFNVSAYADEAAVKTSLVDGAVKVNDKHIQPGQAYQDGKVASTNIKQDVAWKNGYFDFQDVDIKTALRQISRWYNIEIQFNNNFVNERLKGKLGRDLTLSQVLIALEKIGVQYQLKGSKLIIGKHSPDPTK